MVEMPTLGKPPRRSSRGAILLVLVGLVVVGGIWYWKRKRARSSAPVAPVSAPIVDASVPAILPVRVHDLDAGRPPETPAHAADQALKRAGMRLVSVKLSG